MQQQLKSIRNSNNNLIGQQKTVCVIPKISEPNKILPKELQLSKQVNHLFLYNLLDVKGKTGVDQELYTGGKKGENKGFKEFSFQVNSNGGNNGTTPLKSKQKLHKIRNLKEFLLEKSQQIVFISRTVTLILQESQKLLFRKLIKNQGLFSVNKSQNAIEKFIQNLSRLCNSLNQNNKFPYLQAEITEAITQKQSFQSHLSSYTKDYLTFNDNFQSSNILLVKQHPVPQTHDSVYCICTRFDYQTVSYGQWFYFSVKRNVSKPTHQNQQDHHKNKTLQNQQNYQNNQNQHIKKSTKKYKFIICNMTKRYSMLGSQMKISVCRNGVWGKQGQNIFYYQNCFKRGKKIINQQQLTIQQINNFSRYHQLYYSLEFQLELREGQEIFVSYNEPYTVTRLSTLLDNFTKVFDGHERDSKDGVLNNLEEKAQAESRQVNAGINNFKKQKKGYKKAETPRLIFKRQSICQTSLKNQIECITFSMRKNLPQNKQKTSHSDPLNQHYQEKKYIFILARAHPIETAGSYVVQGIMNNLFLFLQYKNDIKRRKQLTKYFQIENKGQLFENLFKKFVIKIIPMINPDGVVLGNSRSNFHGYDLNRQWKKSNKVLSSEIFHLKRFLLKYKDRIEMVIDLHGHSKKKNVFAYGMHDFKNPFSTRQFPYILSKLSPKNFLFSQCRFTRLTDLKYQAQNESVDNKNKKQNSKEGTARIWLFRKLLIPNIFTIQNSYCGSMFSKFHYDSSSYGNIGKQILIGMSLYFITISGSETSRIPKKKNPKLQKVQNNQNEFQQFQSKILSIDELKNYKESIMLDLKSKQENISIGMDQINSSQSEDQNRLEEFLLEPQFNLNEKDDISPAKSQSHKLFKKDFQKTPTSNKKRDAFFKRLSTKERQEDEQRQHNFKKRQNRPQYHSAQQNQLNKTKQGNNRISHRYIPPEIKNKIKEIASERKQLMNHKSTTQLQKNVTLSIVELGWDSHRMNSNQKQEHHRGQKYCATDRGHSDTFNYNPNNIYNMYQPISGHQSNLNINLQNKINQKIKTKMNILNSLNYIKQQQKKTYIQHPTNVTADLYNKIQHRKNVTQFMKKIESNRKLQHEIVSNKKIQKYKQIIIRLNGNNNNK